MKNNRGMTLVELLVAFAVSAVILSGIAYMIFTGLRLYGRTGANVEVQNEVQTAMNLIIDNVMEAKGICLVTPAVGDSTKCVMLGELKIQESSLGTGNYKAYFKGCAVVTDIDRPDADGKPLGLMYLISFPNGDFPVDSVMPGFCSLGEGGTLESAAKDALDKIEDYTDGFDETDRETWLLSRYISACTILPDRPAEILSKQTVYYWNGTNNEQYYFEEPLTLNISISLKYDYRSGEVLRKLEDSVSLRNRVEEIYLNADGSMRKYLRKT